MGTDSSAVPVAVGDPSTGPVIWDRLSAGWEHTCGLTTAGDVYCWGSNTEGELGDGSYTTGPSPVAVIQ